MPEPGTFVPPVRFVTGGRNDGYTDDYLEYAAKAIACLVRQLEAVRPDSKINVSQWRRPAARPLLIASLDRGARGAPPIPSQPAGWGLAEQDLSMRALCRAAWEN